MSDVAFFFAGWVPIARIAIVGTSLYASLVVFLRLSGSRTLASMNAFDFVVTVAIGAVFGRTLTATDVALAEGIVAFGLLVTLQYAVAWLQTRWPRFERAITNPPVLLYFGDEFVRDAMADQRMSEGQLRAAVRKSSVDSLEKVEALVLETDGEISVVRTDGGGSTVEPVVRHQ